jgi:hypothetical protein
MVNIELLDSYVASNPVAAANPNSFLIQLGPVENIIVPSVDNAATSDINSAMRNGTPYFVNLRPSEAFSIDSALFQLLVQNATGGGGSSFIGKICYLINRGVIQVLNDSNTPMTAKQVLSYTAP